MTKQRATEIGLRALRDSGDWSEWLEKAGASASPKRRWLVGRRVAWVIRTRTKGRWIEVEIDDDTEEIVRIQSIGIR